MHAEPTEYSWRIVGRVRNGCDRGMRYVQVSFGFYDANGNLETSGIVNVNNLDAGETWAFRKTVYESISDGGKWGVENVEGHYAF
jgi:hypothetical protein